MILQNRAQRQLAGECCTLLHFLKDWSFFQPAAQPHCDESEHSANQKRNSPGASRYLGLTEYSVETDRHQRPQEDAEAQAAGEQADRETNPSASRMLCNEDPGTGRLSTDGHALQDPHREEKQRRDQADRLIGWEKSNKKGRNGHKQNAERKHALATTSVTEMRHYDAA